MAEGLSTPRKWWSVPLHLGLLLLFVSIGLLFLWLGFGSIRKMRQLERVPRSEPEAVVEGEVNLSGSAKPIGNPLISPRTRTPCVYFDYLVEEEKRDSKNKTSWKTIEHKTEKTDFMLQGKNGAIRIVPSNKAAINVDTSHSERQGKFRYTEKRIDVGAGVFVFGFAVKKSGQMQVEFEQPGEYSALISTRPEEGERTGMATFAVVGCWLALSLLAGSVVTLLSMLRVHSVGIYQALTALVWVAGLVYAGLLLMKTDLVGAHERIAKQTERAVSEVQSALAKYGENFDGSWDKLDALTNSPMVPSAERLRIEQIRVDLARAVKRTNQVRRRFLESVLAPMWQVPEEKEVPMPAEMPEGLVGLEDDFKEARFGAVLNSIIGAAVALLGIALSWWGLRLVKFKRYIENVPTAASAGVVYGLTEIVGTVEPAPEHAPLSSKLSGDACVYYRYVVSEKSGNNWKTIEDETRSVPFVCRDAEGTLTIFPDNAEIISAHADARAGDERRYQESRLAVGDPLYALGSATIDERTMAALVLTRGPSQFPYILSNLSEGDVKFLKGRQGFLFLSSAQSAMILAALMFFGVLGAVSPATFLGAALIPLLLIFLFTLVLMYNDLYFLLMRVRRNWSNIDVSLKKRADLIPQLESVAKAYLQHESETMKLLAAMRDRYTGGFATPHEAVPFLQAENHFVEHIMGLRESNPILKGQDLTGKLMRELIRMENEVALMRAGYNDSVVAYNLRLHSFPEGLLGKLFRFQSAELLEFEGQIRQVPTVAT